jgi:hypothetical protein
VASWVRSSARLVRDVHPAPRIAGIQRRHTAFSAAFRHLTALLLSEKDGSVIAYRPRIPRGTLLVLAGY